MKLLNEQPEEVDVAEVGYSLGYLDWSMICAFLSDSLPLPSKEMLFEVMKTTGFGLV